MSDSEHEVETFETADAGASHTVPMQAGSVRKGGFMVIKGRPTKVIEVTTSKTGKHGHAKCHFTALDIFTNKKVEELVPASHNLEVPIVNRVEYTLLDIDEDDHMSLMDEKGDTREDLKLPGGHSDADKLADDLRAAFDEGKEVSVTILCSMGIEQAHALKEINN